MKKNIKILIISLLIPLIIGAVSGIITNNSMSAYKMVEKPFLSPPGYVFPIVWTILFILMGIGSYLVYISKSKYKDDAITLYGIQLIVNFIWPIIFFAFELRLLAFFVLLLLIILVYKMIREFYKVNKTAAYLQIPYMLWLLFAAYLNFSIYLLNR